MIRTTNTRGGILKVKRSYKYNRSCVCVCVCVCFVLYSVLNPFALVHVGRHPSALLVFLTSSHVPVPAFKSSSIQHEKCQRKCFRNG